MIKITDKNLNKNLLTPIENGNKKAKIYEDLDDLEMKQLISKKRKNRKYLEKLKTHREREFQNMIIDTIKTKESNKNI